MSAKCKICRRLGEKLFLKGDKCMSAKCSMIRKPYPPGLKRKKRAPSLSEYGKELKEKQKLKNCYNLSEHQFRRYIKESLAARPKSKDSVEEEGHSVMVLIRKMESRLDNVVFRLGLASSRAQARQIVSYGHFLVNKRLVNIPSYQVKKGDEVSVRPQSSKNKYFQEITPTLKKKQQPLWLEFDENKLTGKVTGTPSFKEAAVPAEISTIFEYYSR